MKIVFVIITILTCMGSFGQHATRQKIDSLVSVINHSSLTTAADSLYQQDSVTNAMIKTVVILWKDSLDLKKYLHRETAVKSENNGPLAIISESRFFFNGGQLIKVEESITKAGEEKKTAYYFSDNQFLPHDHATLQETERASFLLSTSYSVLKEAKAAINF